MSRYVIVQLPDAVTSEQASRVAQVIEERLAQDKETSKYNIFTSIRPTLRNRLDSELK